MTGKEVRLVNEMASMIINCLSKDKTEKESCMFRNTPMCDGIKLCSSCSMRIEEGDKNGN